MPEIITVIIGLGSGALAAIIIQAFQAKKTRAEAKKVEAEAEKTKADANEQIRKTVMDLLHPLNDRIDGLECQLRDSKKQAMKYLKRIAYLMDGIRQLLGQIEKARMEPVWQPDDWQSDDES